MTNEEMIEWRGLVDKALAQGKQHMAATDQRMEGFEQALKANTEATKRTESNTSEIVEIMGDWKGAMRVLGYIGKLARPLAYIAGLGTAVVGLWTAIRTGIRP